jgi:hypothetical protein
MYQLMMHCPLLGNQPEASQRGMLLHDNPLPPLLVLCYGPVYHLTVLVPPLANDQCYVNRHLPVFG